jgi:hypothetical protein
MALELEDYRPVEAIASLRPIESDRRDRTVMVDEKILWHVAGSSVAEPTTREQLITIVRDSPPSPLDRAGTKSRARWFTNRADRVFADPAIFVCRAQEVWRSCKRTLPKTSRRNRSAEYNMSK